MGEKVSAIIPAYNEADLIGETVRAVKSVPVVYQTIVVDDASTDGTADAARSAGADLVLVLETNHGKGGALNAGWIHAKGSVLLLLDADLGGSAIEAEKLVEPVLADTADMTIGILGGESSGSSFSISSSQGARSGGFGLVMRTARFGIRLLTGKSVTAPLSGQRAVRREVIERVGGFASKFGVEVALTVDALRMGCRLVEVPVGMVHRPSRRDVRGFAHRGRQLLDVVRVLLSRMLRR